VEFRDAKASLMAPYKDDFDFIELGKLAIDYSDGVILASKDANGVLANYTNEKNIPLLNYLEDFGDAYESFYDQICPDVEE
jgi:starch synthase